MQIRFSDENFEQVYLVGVKLQHGAHQADLYTLVLYNEVARNDQNRPLVHDGHIVFFRCVDERNRALELGDVAFRKYKPLGDTVAYVYDVPRVLHIIENESVDQDVLVADFINELLDFVDAAGRTLTDARRAALASLADGATFDKTLRTLEGEEARASARDVLLWSLGAILANGEVRSW
jgi:hypothetical protein